MTSTFTPNIDLEQPARGDDVGTWDTPVNANMSVIDLVVGGRTVISLNNSPVVLSAAQFQANTITFNSTLTGNIIITFPTSFHKAYQIQHACTGSSAFTITLQTTTVGATAVCAVPGQIVTVANYDGFNMAYVDLPPIGSYWDYAGSSVPNWVSGCTVPPWLNCNSTTFSATTYPYLALLLGSTTTPDARGRARYALNQGTGRVTTAGSVVDGDTIFTGGGSQLLQQHNHTATDSGHGHPGSVAQLQGTTAFNLNSAAAFGGNNTSAENTQQVTIATGTANITVANSGSGSNQNMPPALIAGITMIRAG